jgi:hypothetical protein
VENILGEQNALEFNQEEVHKLLQVLEHSLNGLLGNGIVTAGAESTGDTLLEDDLAGNLNGGGHYTSLSTDHPLIVGHATNSHPSDMYKILNAQRRRGR